MLDPNSIVTKIFSANIDFEEVAATVWDYQLAHNPVMQAFCAALGNHEQTFIPIRFFKDFEMRCGSDWQPQAVFKSSGTTGQQSSQHLVKDLKVYDQALMQGFEQFYGKAERAVFALLPNYLERGDSSLVYMVKRWIEQFGLPGSGFYLYNFDALRQALSEAMDRREPILLIGVSYALLDFLEAHAIQLPKDAIVMETGGMKGRGAELTRPQLHAAISAGFGLDEIHSEYGMTELLSQGYQRGKQGFQFPAWAKVVLTDVYNPMKRLEGAGTGRINVIDLANVHSCSFIATDDVGRIDAHAGLEVIGRLDNAALRGCNLLYV